MVGRRHICARGLACCVFAAGIALALTVPRRHVLIRLQVAGPDDREGPPRDAIAIDGPAAVEASDPQLRAVPARLSDARYRAPARGSQVSERRGRTLLRLWSPAMR